MANRTIFRESALAAYRRAAGRDVLPRLTSWPVVLCSWLLLAVLLAAVVLAWSVRVPSHVEGTGVVVDADDPSADGSVVALFMPPEQSARVRPGQVVQGQLGGSGPSVRGEVATVEPAPIGPSRVRERFHLDNSSEILTEPSVVVLVRLSENLPHDVYAGSRVTAQVETGSQPVLRSLLGDGG